MCNVSRFYTGRNELLQLLLALIALRQNDLFSLNLLKSKYRIEYISSGILKFIRKLLAVLEKRYPFYNIIDIF